MGAHVTSGVRASRPFGRSRCRGRRPARASRSAGGSRRARRCRTPARSAGRGATRVAGLDEPLRVWPITRSQRVGVRAAAGCCRTPGRAARCVHHGRRRPAYSLVPHAIAMSMPWWKPRSVRAARVGGVVRRLVQPNGIMIRCAPRVPRRGVAGLVVGVEHPARVRLRGRGRRPAASSRDRSGSEQRRALDYHADHGASALGSAPARHRATRQPLGARRVQRSVALARRRRARSGAAALGERALRGGVLLLALGGLDADRLEAEVARGRTARRACRASRMSQASSKQSATRSEPTSGESRKACL